MADMRTSPALDARRRSGRLTAKLLSIVVGDLSLPRRAPFRFTSTGDWNMTHATVFAMPAAGILLAAGLGVAVAAEPLGTIIELHGEAMVNQGEDFLPARKGMALREADRVFVMENSSASLALNAGCVRELAELEKFTLDNSQTCAPSKPGADIVTNASSSNGVAANMRTIEGAATGQFDERFIGLAGLGTATAGGVVWAVTDDQGGGSGAVFERGPLSPE